MLLEHMQAMERRICSDFDSKLAIMNADLGGKIDFLVRQSTLFTTQNKNFDERLDDIEVVQIPKLKKAVGI